MKIQEVANNKLEREYLVNVPMQLVAETIHSKALKLAETAQMDGFRAGKVPVEIIKQRSKDSLIKETNDGFINQSLQQIVSENKFKLAMQPNANITHFNDQVGLEYSMKLELYPNVPALDPTQFSVTEVVCAVSDQDVAKVIGDLQKAKQQHTKAEETTTTMEGHVVTIDFVGKVNGKEFEGGKAENHKLELGSNQFIPGFEKGLLGLKAGDNTKLNLKFPKDYGASEFAGKKVDFHVTIKEVHHVTLPELDDEFAKSFNATSMDDLKKQIKEELERRYKKVAFSLTKKKLLDVLDKKVNFDLPKTMVEHELATLVSKFTNTKDNKDQTDQLRTKYSKIAERRVKLGFLLSETAQLNNLAITQDDMRNAVVNYAQSMPGKEKDVIDYFNNNPKAVESLKGPIIEEKAVLFILSKSKNKQKQMSIKALLDLVKKTEEENAMA